MSTRRARTEFAAVTREELYHRIKDLEAEIAELKAQHAGKHIQSLTSLKTAYSDASKFTVSDNIITRTGDRGWESCLIGPELQSVCHFFV